ncbi:hypothetical protein AB0M79_28215 [Polymorphospora sp. NPDC051019]|uniref:hypothetical protein n=1 Tax=Polymorphospora sp. NPDC051019 TaxID=3155725 RepID=UPI00341606C0
MQLGRRLLALLVLTAVVISTNAASEGQPRGRLVVTVGGLPSGAVPQVEIDGEGRVWRLGSSKALWVRPGRYTISVAPVDAGEAKFYGAVDAHQVDVAASDTVTVDARYRVAIPYTTKVVDDPEDPPIVAVAPDHVVLIAGEYADSLRPGDAIVVAEGPRTRDGLSRRVVALERKGGTVVARTTPVALLEVVPKLVVQFDHAHTTVMPAPAAGGGGGVLSLPHVPAEPWKRLESTLFEATLHEREGARPQKVEVQLAANMDINIDGYIDIDLWGDPYVEVGVTPKVDYDAGVSFSATGRTNMSTRKDIDLKKQGRSVSRICKSVVGKLLRIGPFSLGCDLKGVAQAEVASNGDIALSRGVKGSHSIPVSWRTGELPKGSLRGWPSEVERYSQTTVSAEGAATAQGGLTFSFGGNTWIADLKLLLRMSYGLEVKASANPLEVTAGQSFEVGLDIEIDVPIDRLDANVNLFSKKFDFGFSTSADHDERDLDPPAHVGIAFRDSAGLHVVRPATGEVETAPEGKGTPNGEILLGPDGRFLAASYLPGSGGYPQSLLIWDTETGKTYWTDETVGYGTFGFVDANTLVGIETDYPMDADDVAEGWLYQVDLPSGKLQRVASVPPYTDFAGLTSTGTVLALEPKWRDGKVWDQESSNLLWLSPDGEVSRRLHLDAVVSRGVMSPDRTRVAAVAAPWDTMSKFFIVDVESGQATSVDASRTGQLLNPESVRWADNTRVLAQEYDPDNPEGARTMMWESNEWHIVDTETDVYAIALGRGIQAVLTSHPYLSEPRPGDLYLFYGRPYAQRYDLYTQPQRQDEPISRGGVNRISFPVWQQPTFTPN